SRPRAAEILRKALRFTVFVDSIELARRAVEFARTYGVPFRIWLEIDSGEHRTGVDPEDPAMLEIARVLSDPAVTFEGVATHAGQSYRVWEPERLRDVAEKERLTIIAAAQKLRAASLVVEGASAGSTPTAM